MIPPWEQSAASAEADPQAELRERGKGAGAKIAHELATAAGQDEGIAAALRWQESLQEAWPKPPVRSAMISDAYMDSRGDADSRVGRDPDFRIGFNGRGGFTLENYAQSFAPAYAVGFYSERAVSLDSSLLSPDRALMSFEEWEEAGSKREAAIRKEAASDLRKHLKKVPEIRRRGRRQIKRLCADAQRDMARAGGPPF